METTKFSQTKLSKAEWNSIEIPLQSDQKEILQLIIDGFSNVHIKYNKTPSLLSYMKMENDASDSLHSHLFDTFFKETIEKQKKKYKIGDDFFAQSTSTSSATSTATAVGGKKAMQFRIENTTKNLANEKDGIFEFVLIDIASKIFKYFADNNRRWNLHFYTLYHLTKKSNIPFINPHVNCYVEKIVCAFEDKIVKTELIRKAVDIMERNDALLKHSNMCLYDHQKQIFGFFADNFHSPTRPPKLALYSAPTGTGKTMSPLGLLTKYRVIFVCAARHVGLALARCAIAMGKKIAFAFGCSSASDIRLHNSAAKEFTKNYKTGGIYKVDNSVGDKVEMIISDVKSYSYAMYYMLAFHDRKNMILYWDEPTISLDYAEHHLHSEIHEVWSKNEIPNVVLSSATLPGIDEIRDVLNSFVEKFGNDPEIYGGDLESEDADVDFCNIVSHDCRKTIPVVNPAGFIELPHYLFETYDEVCASARHILQHKTLLRYLDLGEIVRFCYQLNEYHRSLVEEEDDLDDVSEGVRGVISSEEFEIDKYFGNSLERIDMQSIKIYYLELLLHIHPQIWHTVFNSSKATRKPRLTATSTATSTSTAGVYITTKDAYTLTDGPTLYMTDEEQKISSFCLKQAAIPDEVMKQLVDTIRKNNQLQSKLMDLRKDLEDRMQKYADNDRKVAENRVDDDTKKLQNKVRELEGEFEIATLNTAYIPNSPAHLARWVSSKMLRFIEEGAKSDKEKDRPDEYYGKPFTSEIDDTIVEKIMTLNDVDPIWKILLLMGIGVFPSTKNEGTKNEGTKNEGTKNEGTKNEGVGVDSSSSFTNNYVEIMKTLADQKKLYLIIASTDYIYGTNYQFCHGYIGKDLTGKTLSSEKLIQALGRIGRNNIQQNYTIRFRDADIIHKLFLADTEKPEVANMNRLFCL